MLLKIFAWSIKRQRTRRENKNEKVIYFALYKTKKKDDEF